MFWLWAGFFVLILILLALDLGVFHRRTHEIGMKEAFGWTAFWIVLGLGFSGVVYLVYEHQWMGAELVPDRHMLASAGAEAVLRYLTGYLLEKSLSLDNMFVMSVIFAALQVPNLHQHRVLFWGIIGALVFRTLFIGGGVWLVKHFTWTLYLFGALLVFSGVRMLVRRKDADPEKSWFLRLSRRLLPVTSGPHEGHFTVVEDGRRKFTQLALALVAIEAADVVFAVDSVPAILAITTDSFIVITSNVFAILGLRSLYFVLANMISRFHYLKVALSLLLVIIGAKMLLHRLLHIPNLVSLGVIVGVVAVGIVASLLRPERGSEDVE